MPDSDVASRDATALYVRALSRLHDLALRLAGTSEPQPALQAVLETLVEVHRADFGLISLCDSSLERLTIGASVGFDHAALALLEQLTPEFGERAVIEDVESDRRFESYVGLAREAGFRAVHSTPISTRQGQTIGVLSVHFQTCRRPTESEMQLADLCALHAADAIEAAKSRQALHESERRFRNMADHAPVMIWVTEADGRCTFLGKSWYAFTGRTPETSLGFRWTDAVHPNDRGRARDLFLKASDLQAPFHYEYRLRAKDGDYRWVIDAASPRFGDDGSFLGYIGSVIDITERKMTEEALRASEAALIEADRRKDEFLAMLAHELRNPLAPIRTGLELMRLAGDDRAVLDEVRATLDRQSQQMVRLIDDLLDISRISRGTFELRKSRVELATVVDSAVETARPIVTSLKPTQRGWRK
jgi:PAS domain S-box-containing protein